MKTRKPRHPIAIVGAGIAGLSAADALQRMDIPCFLLERFARPGGRMNSRAGDGWIADHGCRYIQRSDTRIADLIRSVGMEENRVVIQGPIYRVLADRSIVAPPGGGIDPGRLCLDTGFASLSNRLATRFPIHYDKPVSAIRWDNDTKVFWWQKEGQVFWFEDNKGRPIREPVTRRVMIASGVILATTPSAALTIARKSPSIHDTLPLLEPVRYTPTFTGIFRIPRHRAPFYALEGDGVGRIAWLSFEDRKAPERIETGDFSLVLVDASPRWSEDLVSMPGDEALNLLWNEARSVYTALPETPVSRTYKRWNISRMIGEPVGVAPTRRIPAWPVNPPHAPFALAGDYLLGNRAEDAARAGLLAAQYVADRIPSRHMFLGLELQS